MFRKITLTIIMLSITFVFAGCKKTSDSGIEEATTDDKVQAEQEITREKAVAELEKLEKEIDADK